MHNQPKSLISHVLSSLMGTMIFQGYAAVSRYLCVPVLIPAYTLQSSPLHLMCFFSFGFMKINSELLSVLLVF